MKKIICLIFFCISTLLNCNSNQVRIYIICTPSHEALRDEWFLPSLMDNFEIVVENYGQECSTGEFMDPGWLDVMHRKVDVIIKGIEENWGDIFIHSDVDIQFFRPIKDLILSLMDGKDLLAQQDTPWGDLCAGFFICRANEKTLRLWRAVKEKMYEMPKSNDQIILNNLIRVNNSFGIIWDYLPVEFFGGGTLTGKYWNPGDTLPILSDIIMHHANWTKGVNNKIAQLQYVKDEFLKLKFNSFG